MTWQRHDEAVFTPNYAWSLFPKHGYTLPKSQSPQSPQSSHVSLFVELPSAPIPNCFSKAHAWQNAENTLVVVSALSFNRRSVNL